MFKFNLGITATLACIVLSHSAVSNATESTLGSIEFTEMAKEELYGKPRYMDQNEANRYCERLGLRLPTARELARFSMSRGAQGISETNYVGVSASSKKVKAELARMQSQGYFPIYTRNRFGQSSVEFYFNSNGYRLPTEDDGDYFLWSSSLQPDDSSIAYALNGYRGFFNRLHRYPQNDQTGAVRCVGSMN